MTTRTPLIAGNWKMNKDHLEAISFVQKLAWTLEDAKVDYDDVDVAVLPPFTDLRSVQTLIHGDKLRLQLGAQDLSAHDSGAYTGEISGQFLARLACDYVLVGHSERRQYHDESDQVVGTKLAAARRNEVVPILCVGENLEIRRATTHVETTLEQLDGSLDAAGAAAAGPLVVAYEPVWAIGTGETATAEDAGEMATAIREHLRARLGDAAEEARILYGGSVKAGNVAEIMAQADVDGALVGGASLDPKDFAGLVVNAVAPRSS